MISTVVTWLGYAACFAAGYYIGFLINRRLRRSGVPEWGIGLLWSGYSVGASLAFAICEQWLWSGLAGALGLTCIAGTVLFYRDAEAVR